MRKLHQQKLTLLCNFALIVLLFLPAGCEKKEPLKIGFVGGLSGRVADLGIAGRNGAIMAIEERNLEGGIGKRRIELIVKDDQQDPAVARQVVEELIDQDVVAIIGHMTSAMSVTTVPLVNKKHLVMISPTTTTTQLSGLDDYFFRVIDTTEDYAQRGAEFFYRQQGVRKIGVIYDLNNEAYSVSYLNSFRAPYEKLGGTLVNVQAFSSGESVSYLSLIEQTLSPGIEGLLIISSALDAALLCQQLRKTQPELPVIVSEWSATEQFISMGGQAVEGVYAHQYFDRDRQDPRYLAFRQTYIARFDEEPGFASVGGYDAASVVIEALEREADPQKLKESILAIGSFAGLQDTIRFDAFGDTSRQTHLSVVRNGRFVTRD